MKSKLLLLVTFIASFLTITSSNVSASSYCGTYATGNGNVNNGYVGWMPLSNPPTNPVFSYTNLSSWNSLSLQQKLLTYPLYTDQIPSGGCSSLDVRYVDTTVAPTTTVPPTTTVSPTTTVLSTTTVPPTTTVSPTTTQVRWCQPSDSGYSGYPIPNLYHWESISYIYSYYYTSNYYNYSYPSCQTNNFLYLEVKNNFTTLNQNSSIFTYYYDSKVSNCWQIRGVWQGGQSPWSNKICYTYIPPTTTTTTTTVPKVVTPYYFSAPKATPKPKTKKVKVKQTTFYRTGAICADGWRSSATGSGACSHHGGVYKWLGYNKTTWVTKTIPIIPKTPKSSNNCYYCTSPISGLPKTNYVNGYFRSDGTYVSGYWRSK
jgi:hypothetical protein